MVRTGILGGPRSRGHAPFSLRVGCGALHEAPELAQVEGGARLPSQMETKSFTECPQGYKHAPIRAIRSPMPRIRGSRGKSPI